MRRSDFLTDIAQGYEPKIEAVYFCGPNCLPAGAIGMANANPGLEWYRILLKDELLVCPIRAFHTFFHELGHIVLGHFNQLDEEGQERAVIEWAFKEMGTIDPEGKIRKEDAFCFICISLYLKECLK